MTTNEGSPEKPTERKHLAQWVILLDAPRMLIGLCKSGGGQAMRLEPVYELRSQVIPMDGGRAQVFREVMPVGLYFSIRGVNFVPDSHVVFYVNGLEPQEQDELIAAIANCEDALVKTRAVRAGLAIDEPPPKPQGPRLVRP